MPDDSKLLLRIERQCIWFMFVKKLENRPAHILFIFFDFYAKDVSLGGCLKANFACVIAIVTFLNFPLFLSINL